MDETFNALKDSIKGKPIKEEKLSFTFNGQTHVAYLAFDSSTNSKRPAVIIIPEWWGLNDYIRERGKMFAGLGYCALSVDAFGDGTIANNVQEASADTKPYYDNPSLCKGLIDAAIALLKTHPQVDTSELAAAGYCFGGYTAINAGIMGAGVKAAIGFHPSLGVEEPLPGIKTKFLVCSGSNDEFDKGNFQPFKKKMDSAGIKYEFKIYPGAYHAFTNPGADAKGKEFNIPIKYNEAADNASWHDMKDFLRSVFAK